ncbi:hypothetical protein E2C11_13000 [Streptomyces lavendulae]|nr:hypothetical protein E2C11_13000 [Streptomyces lavendulae]
MRRDRHAPATAPYIDVHLWPETETRHAAVAGIAAIYAGGVLGHRGPREPRPRRRRRRGAAGPGRRGPGRPPAAVDDRSAAGGARDGAVRRPERRARLHRCRGPGRRRVRGVPPLGDPAPQGPRLPRGGVLEPTRPSVARRRLPRRSSDPLGVPPTHSAVLRTHSAQASACAVPPGRDARAQLP